MLLLDPPFDAGLYDAALAAARPLLAPQGRLYLEAAEPWDEARVAENLRGSMARAVLESSDLGYDEAAQRVRQALGSDRV